MFITLVFVYHILSLWFRFNLVKLVVNICRREILLIKVVLKCYENRTKEPKQLLSFGFRVFFIIISRITVMSPGRVSFLLLFN